MILPHSPFCSLFNSVFKNHFSQGIMPFFRYTLNKNLVTVSLKHILYLLQPFPFFSRITRDTHYLLKYAQKRVEVIKDQMCILYIYLFIYLSIYICIYVKVRKSVLDGIEIRMTRIEEASTCSPLSLTQLLMIYINSIYFFEINDKQVSWNVF